MGCFYKWDHLEARVPFSTAWLEDHGLAGKRLAVLKVQGDSMSPPLEHGDTPLVEMLPDDIRIIARWTGKKFNCLYS